MLEEAIAKKEEEDKRKTTRANLAAKRQKEAQEAVAAADKTAAKEDAPWEEDGMFAMDEEKTSVEGDKGCNDEGDGPYDDGQPWKKKKTKDKKDKRKAWKEKRKAVEQDSNKRGEANAEEETQVHWKTL